MRGKGSEWEEFACLYLLICLHLHASESSNLEPEASTIVKPLSSLAAQHLRSTWIMSCETLGVSSANFGSSSSAFCYFTEKAYPLVFT